VAISTVGLVHEPMSVGYLIFALPVVGAAGAVSGALSGALAAVIAPLARKGASTHARLVMCAVLYFCALTLAATVLFLIFVPADARPGQAPAVPVATLVATGLAIWGFVRERRRTLHSANRSTPSPAHQ
jgi:hypothetical protein